MVSVAPCMRRTMSDTPRRTASAAGVEIKGNADTRLQVERLVEAPTIVAGVKTFETLYRRAR